MEHARLDRVHWAADDVGNLSSGVAEHGEFHNTAMIAAQSVQASLNQFRQLPLLKGVFG